LSSTISRSVASLSLETSLETSALETSASGFILACRPSTSYRLLLQIVPVVEPRDLDTEGVCDSPEGRICK
jgi:hypothetical protein